MANDPITSMVADPDFGKMPLDEQRKALSAHDANFNGLGDADLTRFVQAHQAARPETQTPTNAAGPININAQAQQAIRSQIPSALIPGTATPDPTGGRMAAAQAGQDPAYNEYQRQSGALAGTVAGGMATGGLLPAIKNLPIANRLISAGGRALATGIGTGTGAAAGGATPREAKVTAESGAIGQPIAEVAVGALTPFVKWLTASKNFGAQMLHEAAFKAGDAPVELSSRTNDLVDKLVETSKLGGKPVKVVSDLLERVGPSTKQAAEAVPGPLTYNEARILQGNMSSLSQEEQMGLKGSQKGLMKQLAQSFSRDVQKAADNAGIGMEHSIGMKEYAAASARNRALVKAGKIAATGAGIYGAEQVAKKAVGAIVRP